MRSGFRRIAHPIEVIDAFAIRRTDSFHKIRVPLLCRLREVLFDEDSAQHHTHRTILGIDDPLPARPRLLLAGKNLMVEVEIFGIDVLAEKRGVFTHQMKPQIVAQRGNRGFLQQRFQAAEKFRLSDDNKGRLEIPRVQAFRPVDRRSALALDLIERHFVVVLLRVAEIFQLARNLRQRRLEFHDVGCRRGLRCVIAAKQLQHVRHMREVFLANPRHTFFFVEIEIAIR